MSRPVTLFTGQWSDLDIDTLCQKAVDFGYDGLELACWGDHLEVANANAAYCKNKRQLLEKYGLQPGLDEVGTRPNPGYPFAGPGLRSAYQHAHVLPCPPLLSPHPALGCGCT